MFHVSLCHLSVCISASADSLSTSVSYPLPLPLFPLSPSSHSVSPSHSPSLSPHLDHPLYAPLSRSFTSLPCLTLRLSVFLFPQSVRSFPQSVRLFCLFVCLPSPSPSSLSPPRPLPPAPLSLSPCVSPLLLVNLIHGILRRPFIHNRDYRQTR